MVSFLIDGYNFLFRLEGAKGASLEKKRDAFIHTLNQELASFKSHVSVVFDSAEQFHDYAQKTPLEHLEVLYAPKGKSADEYIIELVEISKNPKILTVVTSDNGLAGQCQQLGAKTKSIEEFLKVIVKKTRSKPAAKPDNTESPAEVERLLAAFEKRLREN